MGYRIKVNRNSLDVQYDTRLLDPKHDEREMKIAMRKFSQQALDAIHENATHIPGNVSYSIKIEKDCVQVYLLGSLVFNAVAIEDTPQLPEVDDNELVIVWREGVYADVNQRLIDIPRTLWGVFANYPEALKSLYQRHGVNAESRFLESGKVVVQDHRDNRRVYTYHLLLIELNNHLFD